MIPPEPAAPANVKNGISLPEDGTEPQIGSSAPPDAGLSSAPDQIITASTGIPAACVTVAGDAVVADSSAFRGTASPDIVAPQQAREIPLNGIRDILNDPVTLHMGPASPLLSVDHTVSESLDLVRASKDVGRVIYFYVVDRERRMQGVVAVRKLLLSQPETKIAEIMTTRIIEIPSTATVLDACEFFTLHKLLAFPVVDTDRKVIGAVNVDVYTDEIREIDRRQDSDDLFQLIGVHLSEAAQNNARLAFVGRFPWLLCNVAGGMLSALIADAYQDISTLAIVAPFIALVTALAESVSIQSVSLSLQALHTHPPEWKSFARKIGQELLVGLLLGGACGLTVGIIAWLWKGSLVVAGSLFFGIIGGVVASAGVGLSVPYFLKLCRRDPQLASGPIALALSDVVTLLCYFNLGRWLLM